MSNKTLRASIEEKIGQIEALALKDELIQLRQTIRELRALCGEGALAMQDQADVLMERGLTYRYEMDLAAKFRAASERKL